MNNLLLFHSLDNGFKPAILDVVFILALISSIFIIIVKNPILSVLFLIGLFLSVACYLMLIGLEFIGLSYLLVYVGAVSILFLFILMLINIRISELLSDTNKTIPLAIIVGVTFNYIGESLLPYSIANNNAKYSNVFNTLSNEDYSSFVTSSSWDSNLIESSHISALGNIMYTNYSIWLIIASLILLLAMVGTIVITLKTN